LLPQIPRTASHAAGSRATIARTIAPIAREQLPPATLPQRQARPPPTHHIHQAQ